MEVAINYLNVMLKKSRPLDKIIRILADPYRSRLL